VNQKFSPLHTAEFLIWLWLSNVAILLGAEINAELDHAKAVADGLPPEVRPFAEPRDTKNWTSPTRKPCGRLKPCVGK
jgi:hypothetical protein